MLGILRPTTRATFETALGSLSSCADEVSAAGSSLARSYVAGAAGNLRQALTCLAVEHPFIDAVPADAFDQRRIGSSTVVEVAGVADTVRGCLMPDGSLGSAFALMTSLDPAQAVWLRPAPGSPHLHVRGLVHRGGTGMRFQDEGGRELDALPPPGPDLGRDLILSGLDLAGRPVLAVALEVTLAAGSWVELRSGERWFCDPGAARAIVRMLRGTPSLDAGQRLRLGICVEREALLVIEELGWRHWPTPGLRD